MCDLHVLYSWVDSHGYVALPSISLMIAVNWGDTLYCGFTSNWYYKDVWIKISMPGYIPVILYKLQHTKPRQQKGAPYKWNKPLFGASIQYTKNDDDSVLRLPSQIIRLQQITYSILNCAIAVDPTMLVALSDIASKQSKTSITTLAKGKWLLDYSASNPLTTIYYRANGMVLYIHSNTSYLSVSTTYSQVGGHFILSPPSSDPAPKFHLPLNGHTHTIYKILKNITGSAAKS